VKLPDLRKQAVALRATAANTDSARSSSIQFAAVGILNGNLSGTTLTSVVNLNGYWLPLLYTSSMKKAAKP